MIPRIRTRTWWWFWREWESIWFLSNFLIFELGSLFLCFHSSVLWFYPWVVFSWFSRCIHSMYCSSLPHQSTLHFHTWMSSKKSTCMHNSCQDCFHFSKGIFYFVWISMLLSSLLNSWSFQGSSCFCFWFWSSCTWMENLFWMLSSWCWRGIELAFFREGWAFHRFLNNLQMKGWAWLIFFISLRMKYGKSQLRVRTSAEQSPLHQQVVFDNWFGTLGWRVWSGSTWS